jgi:molybdenum cofactor cytidylyltransferase
LGLAATPAGRAPVVAVVGGGGKTSLVYRLGREAAALGLRAVIAGTTRFTHAPHGQPMPPLLTAEQAAIPARIVAAWAHDGARQLVAAGTAPQPPGRLDPLLPATADAVAGLLGLGVLLLEADGSKLHPFKAPADHEPVIPASATHVIAVVGLDALDAPLDGRRVHRPERVRAIVDRPTCDAALIAAVLASPRGGRKAVGARPFAVVVNKADGDREGALRLARAVRAAGVPRVLVTELMDERDPLRATIEA